jgi:hypothetical protein
MVFCFLTCKPPTKGETDNKLKKLADELTRALLTQCSADVTEEEKTNLAEVMKLALAHDLPIKTNAKQQRQ